MKDRILSATIAEDQLALFYIGQAGFIIKFGGKYLMIDGYLSDIADIPSDPRFIRKYPPPIKAEELDFLDYVICTHDHIDHTDPVTLAALGKVNAKAKIIAPAAAVSTVVKAGIAPHRVIAAETGKALALSENITALPIPAAHEELHRDGQGNYCELGFKLLLGDISLYHSGDCCIYDGLTERVGQADMALLPVNGRDPIRRYKENILGNFHPAEAAMIAEAVGARLFVPMHFDLYEGNGLPAAEVVSAIERTAPTLCSHIFRPGEGYLFSKTL